MQIKKTPIVVTVLVSLALLIPGITLPMMTLKANINQQGIIQKGKEVLKEQNLPPMIGQMAFNMLDSIKTDEQLTVMDKTRSILGTSSDLWTQGYPIVALLIILFSTVIPCIKLLLLAGAFLLDKACLLQANALLSKWSMADVFAIGILIAFLAARASEKETALISFHTDLHQGFYWFVAYCLVSMAMGKCLISSCNACDKKENTPTP